LLLLALPLAVAVWAFGAVAGTRERNNADQRLVHAINAAGHRYERASGAARTTAGRVANIRRVQRAFVSPNRRALRRLQGSYASAGVLLLPRGTPPPAAMGRADVKVRGKVIGRVLAGVLDQGLARRLAAG
jgi:hypothetical protein